MAPKDDSKSSSSGMGRLREELGSYVSARAGSLASSLGDRVSGLTDNLKEAADNGGTLGGVASRVMGGESPVKSVVKEKAKGVKDKVVDKTKDMLGGGSGGTSGGAGDTKVTNIVEVIDVGVPLRTAYDRWCDFEEFGTFTKGVRNVSVKDEIASSWKIKVAFSTRGWEATIDEQIADDRIVWSSEGSKGTTRGAISFHELAPNLTRIVVVVEYYPQGFFEKTGNIWRAQGRRLRLDLKHFQRYVTLEAEEEPEGWRGEIRDGEVVRSHEEGLEDDEDNEEGEEDQDGEEEPEEEEEEEEEDEEGAEDEDETDEEEDEKEKD